MDGSLLWLLEVVKPLVQTIATYKAIRSVYDGAVAIADTIPIANSDWKKLDYYIHMDLPNWEKFYAYHSKDFVHAVLPGGLLRLPQVLIFDNTNPAFDTKLSVQKTSESFSLDPELDSLTKEILQKRKQFCEHHDIVFEDNPVLRLDSFDKTTGVLSVSELRYFDYCRTNFSMDAQLGTTTLRKYIHHKGRLNDFEGSRLGNSIGINQIVFTSDGFMIAQERSKSVAIRQGEICPGVSGTLDAGDIGVNRPVMKAPEPLQLMREGKMELGFGKDDIDFEKSRVLGITRELIRGGLPEIFAVTYLKITKDSLDKKAYDKQVAPENWEWKQNTKKKTGLVYVHYGPVCFPHNIESDKDVEELLGVTKNFINKYPGKMSMTMLTAISLLNDYLLHNHTYQFDAAWAQST